MVSLPSVRIDRFYPLPPVGRGLRALAAESRTTPSLHRAGRRHEAMTSAASGATTKLPKSHAPASAAVDLETPPPSPAALAMMPLSAAPSATAKSWVLGISDGV